MKPRWAGLVGMAATAVFTLVLGFAAPSLANEKDAAPRRAGDAIREAARDVGHATRDVAKSVGHATRDIVHDIGRALRGDGRRKSD